MTVFFKGDSVPYLMVITDLLLAGWLPLIFEAAEGRGQKTQTPKSLEVNRTGHKKPKLRRFIQEKKTTSEDLLCYSPATASQSGPYT